MSDPLGLVSGSSGISRDFAPIRSDRAAGSSGGFRELLENELAEVNQLQQDAKNAVEDLAAGRRDDLEGVIIATQKADTAFRMLLQVRNKVMDALEEVKQVRV
jgi:flagellar hook-basal body complex protein FliE